MKLSIVMMVKNESKHLEDALKSITPISERIKCEIIVLDTGSSDNTVEIAKKYTKKVYYKEWNNNFSSMRNKSISYAKGEWIFILDGDEIMSNQESLIDFFELGKDKQFNSAFVNVKNILNETDGAFNLAVQRRLFRNSKNFRYVGTVHNQPIYEEPHVLLDTTLIHYGYLSTDKELMEKKFKRTSTLLHEQLKREPENIYFIYQLSKSYGMNKDYDKALYYIKKAYKIAKIKKIDMSEIMYIYSYFVVSLWNTKNYSLLEKICKEAISINDSIMDFFYYLGNVYSMKGEIDNAITNFEYYLNLLKDYEDPSIKKKSTLTQNTVSYKDRALVFLCNLYERGKKYNKVIQYSKEINDVFQLKKVLPTVINTYLELNDYQGLVAYSQDELIISNEDIAKSFYYQLEKHLFNIEDIKQKENIIESFSHGDSNYNILNKVRLEIKADKVGLEQSLLSQITEMDFSVLPDYYGELIYYLLINNHPIYDLFIKVQDSKLNKYLYHLSRSYDNLSQVIANYITNFKLENNIKKVRVNKHLLRYALLFIDSTNDNYSFLFNRYIEEGIYYIEFYYSKDFIKSDIIYDAKSTEDEFFIYINKAFEIKSSDKLLYVRFLRKALEVYPEMNKGIESLISDYSKPTKEMNEAIEVLKQQIETLLSQNLLKEALEVVNESLKIISTNADLYSIKAIILLSMKKSDEAIRTLEKGLKTDPNHVDSLYNLGYINEIKGQSNLAIELYKKILVLTKEETLIRELEDKIEQLENKR